MNIVLMRHATAEDPSSLAAAATRDAARALTDSGRREARRMAQHVHQLLRRIDRLATSPYVRTRQTADILAEEFDCGAPVEVPALSVGGASIKGVLAWLQSQAPGDTVMLVGHEPTLSVLASWLLTGRETSIVEFRKASVCLVAFVGGPIPGSGRLVWLLPPNLN